MEELRRIIERLENEPEMKRKERQKEQIKAHYEANKDTERFKAKNRERQRRYWLKKKRTQEVST